MIIYCIDDDKSTLRCYRSILGQNHEVHCFLSGDTALKAMQTLKPEVIICDLCMPFTDGYRVIDKAKSIVPNAIYIVASALDAELHAAASKSINCFFWSKGSKYKDLEEMINA